MQFIRGGGAPNIGAEPLHKLLPKMSNQGGFRITNRDDHSNFPAYVVIYTTGIEPEWPDFLDVETGIFRYYGDNRKPGTQLHDTKKKGNELLKRMFDWLNDEEKIHLIPPILIFRKTGLGRDVQFLGLAVPGNPNIPPDRDLTAFWRTYNNQRFQNYEAHFTVLDTGICNNLKEWLALRVYDFPTSEQHAPLNWKKYITHGRNGIRALKAKKIKDTPNKKSQIPDLLEEVRIITQIIERFKNNPYAFEECAVKIIQLMDPNFYAFDLTRPWRDGGRDAIGKYKIGANAFPLTIDCALEAKCYSLNNSVGVKQMSRLISRIKYREFGVLVTTSYLAPQAFSEILDDGHPILIVTANDILKILKDNAIIGDNLTIWLQQF